ncbi:MAG TPA: PoNe immunity protein domain-containing protein [Paraburkholderia sp.]|uniref:PoNe immunity protein domain-containing protein n=1 Tax=Paraburkholderia sp. TaxID=1926495 RepID=UPI002C5F3764|nr:PoNe immunity protein domain-containing protein [Paraburkholderia sp.]HTR06336.1 PoNe immunity protein domain-containing protein [Paraburkholderia sp.]
MNFSKQRRQKYLTEKYYVEMERSYHNRARLAHNSLTSGKPLAPSAPDRLRWKIAAESLELILLNYTAGQPIEELRGQFPEVIKRFNVFIEKDVSPRNMKPARNVADTLEISQIDAYVYVFWLLALCKLLRHGEYISEVLKWVNRTRNYSRGQDGLFEAVVEKLTGLHVETPRVLLHPDPYRPLASATVRAPEERPALVKAFVENWYKGMKDTYWQGSHVDGAYFGYWCLEAALVTVLWDIDDRSYRDNLVYPKALVDWYRGNPGVGTDGGPPKPKVVIRAKPGEPCPQSGNWISPHLDNKIVKMTAGEAMPGPEYGPTGAVIWYLEVKE